VLAANEPLVYGAFLHNLGEGELANSGDPFSGIDREKVERAQQRTLYRFGVLIK